MSFLGPQFPRENSGRIAIILFLFNQLIPSSRVSQSSKKRIRDSRGDGSRGYTHQNHHEEEALSLFGRLGSGHAL